MSFGMWEKSCVHPGLRDKFDCIDTDVQNSLSRRRPASNEIIMIKRHYAIFRAIVVLLAIIPNTLALLPTRGNAGIVNQNGGATGEYRLDTSDKIRLKAFQWLRGQDRVVDWAALNDTFTVGAGGEILLPLIGSVVARGATPVELSERIGANLQRHLGVVTDIKISVEVVQFRPFYVTGMVERPGEYPFRPNLTVAQSIAIAGGFYRGKDTVQGSKRDFITLDGDAQLLENEQQRLLAKRARLEAQIAGADSIEFPSSEGLEKQEAHDITSQEAALFEVQKQNQKERFAILQNAKEQLASELANIEKQLVSSQSHVDLAKSELSRLKELAEGKLVPNVRVVEAQQQVYQLDLIHLRLESEMRRVTQEINKAEIILQETYSKQTSDTRVELSATVARLLEIKRRLRSLEQLKGSLVGSDGALAEFNSASIDFEFVIMRSKGQSLSNIEATEATLVKPGDTIKVQVKRAQAPSVKSDPTSASKLNSRSTESGGF
jgi:polysaccharide export outer membrane protein/exopolysaccharide production protein ExoF